MDTPTPTQSPPKPRKRRRPGRPSKLTPDTVDRILNAVRCGAPNKVACAAAGVSEQAFYKWQQRADEPGASKEYREFVEALTRARQEGIAARLAIIQKASRMDWRAAAWLLERDLPEAFSLKFRVEHSAAPQNIGDMIASLREDRDPPPQLEAPNR